MMSRYKIVILLSLCIVPLTVQNLFAGAAYLEYTEARSYVDTYQQDHAVSRFHRLVENYPLSMFAPKALYAIAEYEFLKNDYFDSSNAFMQLIENYARTREAMFSYVYLARIYSDKKDLENEKRLQNLLIDAYFPRPFKKRYSTDTYRNCFGFTSAFNHKYYARHYADKVEFYMDEKPFYTINLPQPEPSE